VLKHGQTRLLPFAAVEIAVKVVIVLFCGQFQ
jgi:hypothetical protein